MNENILLFVLKFVIPGLVSDTIVCLLPSRVADLGVITDVDVMVLTGHIAVISIYDFLKVCN